MTEKLEMRIAREVITLKGQECDLLQLSGPTWDAGTELNYELFAPMMDSASFYYAHKLGEFFVIKWTECSKEVAKIGGGEVIDTALNREKAYERMYQTVLKEAREGVEKWNSHKLNKDFQIGLRDLTQSGGKA